MRGNTRPSLRDFSETVAAATNMQRSLTVAKWVIFCSLSLFYWVLRDSPKGALILTFRTSV
jgi:hypothetical protein